MPLGISSCRRPVALLTSADFQFSNVFPIFQFSNWKNWNFIGKIGHATTSTNTFVIRIIKPTAQPFAQQFSNCFPIGKIGKIGKSTTYRILKSLRDKGYLKE